jgi:hypothetical protein
MLDQRLASLAGAMLVVLAACSNPVPDGAPSAEVLGATIRAAGLRCASVSSADVIAERQGAWRVSCSDALVYAATLAENDELCIEPILAGGFSGELILPPDPRCATLSRAE